MVQLIQFTYTLSSHQHQYIIFEKVFPSQSDDILPRGQTPDPLPRFNEGAASSLQIFPTTAKGILKQDSQDHGSQTLSDQDRICPDFL